MFQKIESEAVAPVPTARKILNLSLPLILPLILFWLLKTFPIPYILALFVLGPVIFVLGLVSLFIDVLRVLSGHPLEDD